MAGERTPIYYHHKNGAWKAPGVPADVLHINNHLALTCRKIRHELSKVALPAAKHHIIRIEDSKDFYHTLSKHWTISDGKAMDEDTFLADPECNPISSDDVSVLDSLRIEICADDVGAAMIVEDLVGTYAANLAELHWAEHNTYSTPDGREIRHIAHLSLLFFGITKEAAVSAWLARLPREQWRQHIQNYVVADFELDEDCQADPEAPRLLSNLYSAASKGLIRGIW